ncbi:MAG TPA: cysteine desulfurase [Rhodothermales bacterium]
MEVAQTLTRTAHAFDVERYRRDFPALAQTVHGRPLVYLDNAATGQKPRSVIERLTRYYETENANVHRGVHYLSQTATDAYEGSRARIARFINAGRTSEVIFTRGTTEGINLVAAAYGRTHVGPGDEVLITTLEHHSNIVPWQLLCEEKGAQLRVVPLLDDGQIDFEAYRELLSDRTRVVSIAHVSNSLGTVLPVERMIEEAHRVGAVAVVDGAQAVPHLRVDVQALDCDFYAFSGHKMFGPTGTGVLFGRHELLSAMPPYQGGGDMIDRVTFERTTWNELPHKFEAGTPHIAGFIGLAAAVEYLEEVGLDAIAAHEHDLLEYANEQILAVGGVTLVGTAPGKAAVVSFLVDGVHPYDAGSVLDRLGVAVRTGHHCTQPLMDRFGIPGTVRASFAFYNTRSDVDALVAGIEQVKRLFG